MHAVREWLKQARSVAVLTGAGVSAESGVPTFRGNNGLWKQYRAEDLATPGAFARDQALVELERRVSSFTLITQNVDGLHELAGSRNVLEVHGSIWRMRCTSCAREQMDRRTPLPEIPPKCECGGLLRPGVVWFGEALPPRIWHDAEAVARSAEVFLLVGTSAIVYPAAGLAQIAKASGARVVEINIVETVISSEIDEFLQGPSGELLPQLIA